MTDRIDDLITALHAHWPDARLTRIFQDRGRDLIEVSFGASWWRLTPDAADVVLRDHRHEDGVQPILNRYATGRSDNA